MIQDIAREIVQGKVFFFLSLILVFGVEEDLKQISHFHPKLFLITSSLHNFQLQDGKYYSQNCTSAGLER
jgi:hypothetical protein